MMYIPEWEIEELIAQNPRLLGLGSKSILLARQKHLEKEGRYIDLLFRQGTSLLIVEIKAHFVDDKSVIFEQIIPYKKALAEELGIPPNKVKCVLVSPVGFSSEIKALCQEMGIKTKKINKSKLFGTYRLGIKNDIGLDIVKSKPSHNPIKASTEYSMQELAKLFVAISNNAPIMAHEVFTDSNGKLKTNYDMWFWLFYSSMDRRANASTFVKAKEALERVRLFAPYKIVQLAKERGEQSALNKIAKVLEESSFPLLSDTRLGKYSFPKSIVDSAKFISLHNYDFYQLYETYIKTAQGDLRKARDMLWKDLQTKIYGVGPRIASQIIRGLVLKGPWSFPLDDDKFLEKCRYNVWIAESRLGLIKNEREYNEKLGKFADIYLSGNRGIIAHVLWFIRKRYCNRPPRCQECPLANYCLRGVASQKHNN